MRLAETQILGVDGLWWSEPIPEPPCEIPYFDSVHLGRLVDHEENRLAAAAADDRGWPMEQMTGARVDDPGAAKSGLSLRQMAVIRYTSWKGSEP